MTPEYHACECPPDVDFGSYDRYVELVAPPHLKRDDGRGICLDVCLALEVTQLWKHGIKTTGCCCGHNKLPPTISVHASDTNRMRLLGYVYYVNPFNASIFYAKSRAISYSRD